MRSLVLVLAISLAPSLACSKDPLVVLETSQGKITVRLFPQKAPLTVQNFLKYVDDGFYSGTIFHRVIPGFMIQGGGITADLQEKATRDPVKNEADNGLKNKRGTLAMARTSVVDSATAQFFINVEDNAFLDHRSKDAGGFGYAVFGEVAEGMDVVDKIKATKTRCPSKPPAPCQEPLPPGMRDVPAEAITIVKAFRK